MTKPCRVCGSLEKYGDNRCVPCRGRWKENQRKNKRDSQKRKEQLEILAYHKRNPQLSCQQWG